MLIAPFPDLCLLVPLNTTFIFQYLVVDFYFMPKSTVGVIWSRNLSLKPHLKDWKSKDLSQRTVAYRLITTRPEKLIAKGPAFDTV